MARHDDDWLRSFDWEYESGAPRLMLENPNDSDNCLTLAVSESGRLIVSVSDEQAVDSYNAKFECSIHIPAKLVPQLVKYLTDSFPHHPDQTK